jgi:hypothetical protein
MLGTLDFLGALKWPSLFAVTLLPLASYALDWRHLHLPQGPMRYGPAVVGGTTLTLRHDGRAQPADGGTTRWCARVTGAPGAHVDLAYDAGRRAQWTRAIRDGGDHCATLAATAPRQVRVRVRLPDGMHERSWALDGARG